MPRKVNGTTGWQPVASIPRDKIIKIKTVRGIVCTGLVPKAEKVRKPDSRVKVPRINARRMEKGTKIGDVRAVAWR